MGQIWAKKTETPYENRRLRVAIAGAGMTNEESVLNKEQTTTGPHQSLLGPAGLSIAGILAREAPGRFDIHVFERDSRERDQGSGWDIDARGRRTLSRAGLDPKTISRPGCRELLCLAFSDISH